MRKIHSIAVFLFVCVLFFAGSIHVLAKAPDRNTDPYRIICISSYNYSYSTVPEQLSGFVDGLGSMSYDIDYEFMDSKNFYHPEDLRQFYDFIDYKVTHSDPYNLVVLSDDNALRFWKNYRGKLFKDIPTVFLGINNLVDAQTADEMEQVTGIAEVPDYIASFQLMHDMFPDRKRVVAVVDGSITGRGEYALFQETSADYSAFTYSVINTADYSRNGLIEALQKLTDDDIILYLDFLEDGDGNIYTERTASTLLYENAANVPIFRVSSANVGYGVLGGIVYSHYDAGVLAGKMAAKIADGTPLSDIPMVDEPITTSIFDQDIMDKFHLSLRDLPEGSTIINEHPSLIKFYKENTLLSNLILIIIAMMIAIITILFMSNRRRERLINQDFLTQMPNRLYINAKLRQTIDRREAFGLLMMDVDHFKTINDTLGHPIGDELLIEVAKRLKKLSSGHLQIARIGGDEFMALLLGKSVNEAEAICQRILASIKEEYLLSSGPLNITASLGCALYPNHTDDPTKVMNYADAALYEVKERGRNGYQLFHPTLKKYLTKAHL